MQSGNVRKREFVVTWSMPKIIHAISGPRNISTALMYSFAQRPGCAVFDEPMYGVYLKKVDPDHPGLEDVLLQWPTTLEGVRNQVAALSSHDEIYLKNMAHHMHGEPWHWVEPSAYVFWIRHPRKVVQSFAKVIDHVEARDIGLIEEWEQWRSIQSLPGAKCIVDSDELLANPRENFPKVCEALGIPWREQMLYWPAGHKAFDGPWWPHWYANVHKSTGFGPPKRMPEPLERRYEKVVQETLPAYEALYSNRLKF